jgi:hypothetical protein
MAKFLNTTGISHQLEKLIQNTKKQLILVSPYLQVNERIKQLIKSIASQNKDIAIIYRADKVRPDDFNWITSQAGVKAYRSNNLHAKCYINDDEAIITSMNLYSHSQENNHEMGVYILKSADEELFNDTMKEVKYLLSISDEEKKTVEKSINGSSKQPTGYCIRTGVPMPFNIKRPMCSEAYRKWEEYSNEDYPEKYCHFSGEQSHGETSKKQPVLSKNWKKAKDIFKLKQT